MTGLSARAQWKEIQEVVKTNPKLVLQHVRKRTAAVKKRLNDLESKEVSDINVCVNMLMCLSVSMQVYTFESTHTNHM